MLGDLHITGYGAQYGNGGIKIAKLDNYGSELAAYYWIDLPEEDPWPAQYGWWDEMGYNEYNDVPFEQGTGFWLDINDSGLKISDIRVQSSGQVNEETVPIMLPTRCAICPNPTPITLKIGQVWIDGYGPEYGAGGIKAAKLDNYGSEVASYYWIDLPEFDPWPAQYGWWDEMGNDEYNEKVFVEPGEMLWVDNNDPNFAANVLSINWPSALDPDSNAKARAAAE